MVGVLGPGLGHPGREVLAGPQPVDRLVALEHLAGDGVAVHLGGPVDQTHDRRRHPHPAERHLVGDAERPVDLDGPLGHVVEDLGGEDLDGGDVPPDGPAVAPLVDAPGHVHDQQPELEQLDVGVGHEVAHALLVGQHAVTWSFG